MLNLDYRDPRPVYEQVRDGLRRLMVTGAIRAGEKLPSVRSLAGSLAINPNTIQRAYEALEAEGYVYSVPGKGSFASGNTGVDRERRDALFRQFDQTAAELLFLGVSAQELRARIPEGAEQKDFMEKEKREGSESPCSRSIE
jgi:GntR family transcriptional regulator